LLMEAGSAAACAQQKNDWRKKAMTLCPGPQPPDLLAQLLLRYWGVGPSLDSTEIEVLLFACTIENEKLGGSIARDARTKLMLTKGRAIAEAIRPALKDEDPLQHGRNCSGEIPGREDECTCGLKWRLQLAAAEKKFREHTQAVSGFLSEMYATMVDPVDEINMKVEDLCALLLQRARDDREAAKRAQQMRASAKYEWCAGDYGNWRLVQILCDISPHAIDSASAKRAEVEAEINQSLRERYPELQLPELNLALRVWLLASIGAQCREATAEDSTADAADMQELLGRIADAVNSMSLDCSIATEPATDPAKGERF